MPIIGRPTLLTTEIQKKICEAIRVGTPREVAATYAGVHPATLYEWLKKGEAGDEKYRAFAEALRAADSDCVVSALARVAKAAHEPKNWGAATWLLERKMPAQFAQRVRVTLETEQNEFLEKLERGLPAEIFQRVLDVVTTGGAAQSEVHAGEGAGGATGEGSDPEGTPDAG